MRKKKKKVTFCELDGNVKNTVGDETKYPPNVSPVPANIQHLVNKGALQYEVASDGNCGFKAGATHIFRDPQYGIPFRKLINNHIADRFNDYYCNRISRVKSHFQNSA